MNKFEHMLDMVVFRCDDEGQIIKPSSPEEYFEAYKAKGITFESEDYEIKTIGTSWYLSSGGRIATIPYSLVEEVMVHMY
jgi:hypothetical protein